MSGFLIFFSKDRKVEMWIFFYGLTAGAFIEIIGTKISGYQNFENPDILGIPYWLLVAWGYGFVLMKRIGLILKNNSPW